MFQFAKHDEIIQVAKLMKIKMYLPDESICIQGEEGKFLGILLSGTAKVYIRNKKLSKTTKIPISKENIDELVSKFNLA